jgi:hypothetical protein
MMMSNEASCLVGAGFFKAELHQNTRIEIKRAPWALTLVPLVLNGFRKRRTGNLDRFKAWHRT